MVKIRKGVSTLAGHMPPANLEREQLHRLVKQAIARFATPEQRDAVLHDALVAAGVHDVPDNLGEFALFLLGPLQRAATRHLGDAAAKSLVATLEAVTNAQTEAAEHGDDEADHGATVLIIDADPLVRSQLMQIMRAKGYSAASAPDGTVGLAMCVRHRPKLVLAENLDGGARQLAALLRVAFGSDAPQLIVLASEGSVSPIPEAAGVLTKPVSDTEIHALVDDLLSAPKP
jgi:CheY-like chemotaxis protein